MATYGLQATPGTVPFTGYTNTLSGSSAAQGASSGGIGANGVLQGDSAISRWFRNGAQTAGVKALLLSVIGAAAGGTAAKTKAQVQHVTGAPGGAIPIEVITLINRVSTAADVAAFTALFNRNPWPAVYPVDAGGNGGGGKAGI